MPSDVRPPDVAIKDSVDFYELNGRITNIKVCFNSLSYKRTDIWPEDCVHCAGYFHGREDDLVIFEAHFIGVSNNSSEDCDNVYCPLGPDWDFPSTLHHHFCAYPE